MFFPAPILGLDLNISTGNAYRKGSSMSVAIITGSSGLVGSEAVNYFASLGMDVVGIDNGMRAKFFGESASTRWMTDRLRRDVKGFRHYAADIRDIEAISSIFEEYG